MLTKKSALTELTKRIQLNVFGDEKLTNTEPKIFVANHNCLMDIFYLAAALPTATVSFISSRLIYKNVADRKKVVNDLLYSMPIEAHGGIKYSELCLSKAVELLENNISINIFPEGAYIEPNNNIFKGRTGAARILYTAKSNGVNAKIIPVAIEIISDNLNLDSYTTLDDIINVYILDEVNYSYYYQKYITSISKDEKNIYLHSVINDAMKAIAKALNKNYSDEYIELYPKGNVIFRNGTTVASNNVETPYYLRLYEYELNERLFSIVNSGN